MTVPQFYQLKVILDLRKSVIIPINELKFQMTNGNKETTRPVIAKKMQFWSFLSRSISFHLFHIPLILYRSGNSHV